MAKISRGENDSLVMKLKGILDDYELANPGANASVYRQNSASVRIRIVDDRFNGISKGDRHDAVWKFISDRLTDDEIQEISVLLPLAPKELESSFMNAEFEDPVASSL